MTKKTRVRGGQLSAGTSSGMREEIRRENIKERQRQIMNNNVNKAQTMQGRSNKVYDVQ